MILKTKISPIVLLKVALKLLFIAKMILNFLLRKYQAKPMKKNKLIIKRTKMTKLKFLIFRKIMKKKNFSLKIKKKIDLRIRNINGYKN